MLLTIQLSNIIQAMQAQASLKEAESARMMNSIVLLFTIVTVIFVRPGINFDRWDLVSC